MQFILRTALRCTGAGHGDNAGMNAPLLLLVDGSSYLYRAYHAMPDLRGPDGFPTGAVHGFIAMMKRLREQYPAAHAACVFDAPGKTFRDDWYAEYKAHRPPMPEPLAQQIEPIHEAVRLLGWPVLQVPGIEADDAIGTLARAAEAAGHRVLVSTGDKDLAQLVTPQVTLVNTMSNETLDVAAVQAKFGVPPARIVDYLTLVGDTVDNVPGVDKVGPKTAAKWIAEHGSLDGVMAAADAIKGAAGENLRRALDWLPTGRRLVTVATDCDLTAHLAGWPALDALRLGEVDRTGLLDFFQRYGFRTWRRELEAELGVAPADAGTAPVAAPPNDPGHTAAADPQAADDAEAAARRLPIAREYETITAWEQFDAWLARIEQAELTALDTETDSLDAMRARIVGISFAVEPGRAAYVPLAHEGPDVPEQLPLDAVLQRLKPWLEDAARPKLGQNIKYDTHVLANHGIAVQGYTHDTLLQSYVLEAHRSAFAGGPGRAPPRPARAPSYEDLCGKGVHQIPFAQVAVDRATEYSGEDSEMALHVHHALWPQLQAQPRLREVYERIELPTSRVLGRIERHGVLIDAAVLARQSQQLAERMAALEQEAYGIAGQPFNLGSPKQIGEILFGKLGLPVKKKTASGAASTDEEVLQELASRLPAAGAHPRAPQPGQAQGHLHRQAAADGQPRHRARAHQLRAGGGGDRGACRATTPTCRTSPSAPPRAGACARPSSRRQGAC
jgi:DNA polymerase I